MLDGPLQYNHILMVASFNTVTLELKFQHGFEGSQKETLEFYPYTLNSIFLMSKINVLYHSNLKTINSAQHQLWHLKSNLFSVN